MSGLGGRPVVGVFDSGFGGLTVLKALLERLPGARFVFLGDTARLPYGSKSQRTIARYAAESAQFLAEEQGAEYLVIACNTASALAMDAIRAAVEEAGSGDGLVVAVPVLGMIEPGAGAAAAGSQTRDVLVMATEATVSSHAYAAACRARGLRAVEKACPLLVPLVEEGWIEHPVTAEVVRIYLRELMEQAKREGLAPDTLVLGCTHYPLLRPMIERLIAELAGPGVVRVIDSAEAAAEEAAVELRALLGSRIGMSLEVEHRVRCFATDSVEKFERLGSRFLGVPVGRVELVDLGG